MVLPAIQPTIQVEAEIRILMERLQRQAVVSPFNSAAVRERDPEALVPRSTKRDKAVLNYMAAAAQAGQQHHGMMRVVPWGHGTCAHATQSSVYTSADQHRAATRKMAPFSLSSTRASSSWQSRKPDVHLQVDAHEAADPLWAHIYHRRVCA